VESLAAGLGVDDLLILLLSGGGSALLPLPAEGLRLVDKIRTTGLLLRSGASIGEINTVRRHLSRLKGGGLARTVAPARVYGLALSDVVGDGLATIASGPCSPDPTTFEDALRILESRRVWARLPGRVKTYLEAGLAGRIPETPKPGDACFRRVTLAVIGSNRRSLDACDREAAQLGYKPLLLTSHLKGEAREVARALVAVLRECASTGAPVLPPVCLLAGGETTVTVRGDGYGGRNQEMATAAAEELDGFPLPAVAAFLGTDGIDGRSDAAGGVVDDETAACARRLGLAPPGAFLDVSASSDLFRASSEPGPQERMSPTSACSSSGERKRSESGRSRYNRVSSGSDQGARRRAGGRVGRGPCHGLGDPF
jgi:glycerate 2-kinase